MIRMLIILLLFSTITRAQFVPGLIGFRFISGPPSPPGGGSSFDWYDLQWEPVATYNNPTGVVIDDKKYSNLNTGNQFGSAIVVSGGSGMFEIKNSAFMNTNGEAIQFENFGNCSADTIWIHDCFFANGKNGISIVGGAAVIIIENNQCINPWGAKGGKGQFIQFNGASACGDSRISDNNVEGYPGEIFSEDLISMFGVTGTPSAPMVVSRNKTRGGGPSDSGGGFIAGDGDGSDIVIEDNVLKNPGNYIVTAAGGGNIILRNNYGWQGNFPWTNIAMYAYITNASTYCTNITITNNHMGMDDGAAYNLYCYCTPGCGDVIGVTEGLPEPSDGWKATNFEDQTEATIDALLPAVLIDMPPENELWKIRDSCALLYRYETAEGGWPASPHRPVSNAGPDQAIGISNTTLTGSVTTTNGTSATRWVQVSGPVNAVITNPASQTTTVTGLTVDGVYEFRFESYDNGNGSGDGIASDADWVTVTVTGV